MITAVYLYGAWHEKWEFSPYWLAACVILDVYWVHSIVAIASGAAMQPIVDVSMKG